MAVNYSPKEVEKAKKNFYGSFYNENNFISKYFFKNLKIIKIKFVNLKNFLKKKIYTEKKIDDLSFKLNNRDSNVYTQEILKNGYTFIENFFDEKSINLINSVWPSKNFFYSADNPLKNYNFGFRYLNNQFQTKYDFEKCNNFKEFYNYLLSDKFTKYVNEIINGKNYKIFSIVASNAKEYSYLIPHQDTVIHEKEVENIVNVIFFVDGDLNAEYSGGTGIYHDNEFKKPIFIPNTLKNSALIYNSKKNLFHGFDIMKKHSFRKAISFQLKETN